MRWGPTPRGALPAAAGARHGARAAARRRTTRATCRPRRRAACCRATSASSCASSATSTTCRHADRGHRRRVVGARRRRPSRSPCSRSRPATSARSTRSRRPAVDRRAGLQPVEHDRRVPAARQPQPGAQGGLRRRRGAPAGLPLGAEAAAAQRGGRRRGADGHSGREPVRRVAPAARAARAAQPRGLPRTCCGSENLLDTEVREAPPSARPVPPAAARRGAARRTHPRRLEQRPLRPGDGRGRRDVRPQPPTASTGPICSTSRTRSSSASSCSTASTSSRHAR